MASIFRRAVTATLFIMACSTAAAEPVEFDSLAFEGEGENMRQWFTLIGRFSFNARGTPVRLDATLSLPDRSPGPVPLVIIGHTSAGVGADVTQLEEALRSAGYATLYYDSYFPRRYGDTNRPGGGGPKLEINQVADAYMALKTLAADKRIDARRIFYAGMSAGGNTALLAALDWLPPRYADNARFAGLIALYPGGYALPEPAGLSKTTPVLILPAERDDLMRWSRTKVWVDFALREKPGLPWKVVMVKDAHHSFMNPNAGGYGSQSPSPTCGYMLLGENVKLARVLEADASITNRPFPPSCFGRGATTEYSNRAAGFAIEQMLAFMKDLRAP